MKVTFAYPYTDGNGKTHEPDSTADLPDEEATQLFRDGRARQPETSTRAKKEA